MSATSSKRFLAILFPNVAIVFSPDSWSIWVSKARSWRLASDATLLWLEAKKAEAPSLYKPDFFYTASAMCGRYSL